MKTVVVDITVVGQKSGGFIRERSQCAPQKCRVDHDIARRHVARAVHQGVKLRFPIGKGVVCVGAAADGPAKHSPQIKRALGLSARFRLSDNSYFSDSSYLSYVSYFSYISH